MSKNPNKATLKLLILTIPLFIFASLACLSESTSSLPTSTASLQHTTTPTMSVDITAGLAEPTTTSVQRTYTPGYACFGTGRSGVFCLDDDGWQHYTSENSPIQSDWIADISTCGDGSMAFVSGEGITKYSPGGWDVTIPKPPYSSPGRIACSPDGQLWVTHYKGIAHYNGVSWETIPASELAFGESASDLVNDVALSNDGTVWVVTSNSIARYDQSEWLIFQQGHGLSNKYYFNRVSMDMDQNPLAANSSSLLHYTGRVWKRIPLDHYITIESLAEDSSGRIWLATLNDGLFKWQNNHWSQFTQENSPLASNRLRDISIDQSGRIWIASEWGLTVIQDEQWTTFRMENATIPDNDISIVAVFGDGPALPTPQERSPGSLSGHIRITSLTPLSETNLRLCPRDPSYAIDETQACDSQPLFFAAQTDSRGYFHFTDLPAGYYYLAYQTGEDWDVVRGVWSIGAQRILISPERETEFEYVINPADE